MRTLGCLGAIVVVFSVAITLCGQLQGQQNLIQKRLDRVDWQPTWEIPGARYVGAEACAQCHATEAASAGGSAMAHALTPAADSLVLESHSRLSFGDGAYGYTLERRGDAVWYAVTNGTHTISVLVPWAFGYGIAEVGQTYLFSYHGSYYESRVSFFRGAQSLDVTLGHSPAVPGSLQNALGRVLQPEEARACFGCHSTRAVSDGRLQIDKLIPGITCEGCHGPGGAHVAAIRAGKSRKTEIFNPGSLSTGDLVKFCGACHRARVQVRALGLRGIATLRFQPYRLTESSCFNPRDSRISCLACHDPHRDPEHDPAFYDSKCLACHGGTVKTRASAQRTAARCPVANSRCVTCHMPKYELRGSHFKFTDHKIRVVRLGDTFD